MCTEVFHLGCGILNTTTTVWRILFLPIFTRQSLSVKLTGLGTLKDVISGFYISTTRKVSPAQQSSQLPFQWDVTSCGRDSRGVSIPLWHLSGKPHIIWSQETKERKEFMWMPGEDKTNGPLESSTDETHTLLVVQIVSKLLSGQNTKIISKGWILHVCNSALADCSNINT